MSDQNSPEETNEEILRVRHWKTLVDLAAKGRMAAKRGGIAGRSILMPVWDDVLTPGGKFTFDETPEQRAQAEIERRGREAVQRSCHHPGVEMSYNEVLARSNEPEQIAKNKAWRESVAYMSDLVGLIDSFKFVFPSDQDRLEADQITSAPLPPLVNYRPTPRSKFKPGAYEYVMTTVNDLGESPASPPTKVHAFDGLDYNFVLHADSGQPRANFYRQVAGKPETRVYVGTCLAGGKVVDYGVGPATNPPKMPLRCDPKGERRITYEIPAVVGMGSTAKISMMSPMSQGGALTIQESAAALAAGFDKVCAKPQPGETCGKCKAVVKERPLFVGIFVGCLC